MALFDGVENFNPAFQGRQLAIQSGQGAGQSIARGTQARQRQQVIDFETGVTEMERAKDTKELDTWAARRKSKLEKPSQSIAVPWSQMPIPGPMGPRTGAAVPWNEMPIPGSKGPGTKEAFPFNDLPPVFPKTGIAVPWEEMPIPDAM